MAHRDALSAIRTARFPSRLEETQALLDWFAQAQPAWLDPLIWIQAQTALVEGFTNAVRHAHGPMANPPSIGVQVEISGNLLGLEIHDHGGSFDLRAAWRAAEEATAADRNQGVPDDPSVLPEREAHWGLIMLLSLHRDHGWVIHYDPLPDGGNLLVLQKALV